MADEPQLKAATRPALLRPAHLIYAIPVLIAVVLSLPCMQFAYLWDDYDFLTNALLHKTGDLLPDPADPFYRPISRGVYFLALIAAGERGELMGHLLNAAFLIGIVLLLVRLVWRLAGPTAGLLAGIFFAGMGAIPTLIAWVCCDQDLLSMLFIMAALHARLSGRSGLSVAWTAAALLSKETALAVVPVLVLLDRLLGREPARIARQAAAYGSLVALWGLAHPAARVLVSRGLMGGATGYVGLERPDRWPLYLAKYLLTMFNLRISIPVPAWPAQLTVLLLVAAVLALVALRALGRQPLGLRSEPGYPTRRVVLLAGLLCAGPLILTSTIIRSWAPYYAAYPALGVSILAGIAGARLPRRWLIGAAVLFLTLGVWSRESKLDPAMPTEKNFRESSRALREVSANFRKLYRTLPPSSQVLLAVQARGKAGIYAQMYVFGVIRIWYGEPTLRTRRPEARDRRGGPEFLFVITPDRDVIEIDPTTLDARTASGRNPDYAFCEGAVRAYAYGLAGSGETDRAVGMLFHMPEISPRLRGVHHRMAAMLLLGDGRDAEAAEILRAEPPIERGYALVNLRAVLAEQPPGRLYDEHAFRAFGIAQTDIEGMRDLMRWFSSMNYAAIAIRFAERVQSLNPGDREAAGVVAKMQKPLGLYQKDPKWPGQLEP